MAAPDSRDDPPAPPAGFDVDPRVTFANERTFLAWVRTALALIAGGADRDADLGARLAGCQPCGGWRRCSTAVDRVLRAPVSAALAVG